MRTKQLAAVALSCVLLATGAWIWHRRSNLEPPAAAGLVLHEASPSHTAEPPASAEPSESGDTVQVRVSGVNGAQVSIDGLDVGRIPLELSLPSKAGHREVSVRRPGYALFTAVIAANDNAIVTARLRPIATRSKVSPGDAH